MFIDQVEAETGASLTQLDELKWQLFAPNAAAFEEASVLIQELMRDEKSILENLEFGAIYPATITELVETGVMIKLEPGKRAVDMRYHCLSFIRLFMHLLGP